MKNHYELGGISDETIEGGCHPPNGEWDYKKKKKKNDDDDDDDDGDDGDDDE